MPDAAGILKLARRLNVGVSIRAATSADGPTFERLMNTHYSRQKPPGYFTWRFEQCPDPSVLMLATDGDDVIGCMGGHVRTLTDGRRVLFSVDLVVKKVARNRGVSLLLEDALETFGRGHGAVALAAMPNPQGLRAHLGFPGCITVGTIPTLVQRSPAASTPPSTRFAQAADPVVRFNRGASYATWRYSANPEYKYARIAFDADTWLVFKHFEDPKTQAAFVDIVELNVSSPTMASDLIAELRRHPSVGDTNAITVWALPHTRVFTMLYHLGFQHEGSSRAFCLRLFESAQNADLRMLEKWDLAECDSEVY